MKKFGKKLEDLFGHFLGRKLFLVGLLIIVYVMTTSSWQKPADIEVRVVETTTEVVIQGNDVVLFTISPGNKWWYAIGEPPKGVILDESMRRNTENCVLAFHLEPEVKEVRFEVAFAPATPADHNVCGW